MKSVPLKELKANLARYTRAAAAGLPIEVTRYNRPYVTLMPAGHASVHIGKRAGQGTVEPIGRALSKGQFLKVLLEDRE